MTKAISLAGIVILYKADIATLDNIESYIDFLETLFVVDNGDSEEVITKLQSAYTNIIFIKHNDNKGISISLNEVLDMCKGKYTHLLTMDQDSKFSDGSMRNYCYEMNRFDWDKTLGLSPTIIDHDVAPLYSGKVKWERTLRVITSGNVISVENAIKIGMFDEKLFIDEVDFEFCYKGNLAGFSVYKCMNGIYLQHALGNKNCFIYRVLRCMNHGFIRKYYIVRNRMYIYSKYHKIDEKFFFTYYIITNLKLFFDIIFLEKDKIRKLRYYFLGIKDFYQGRMGKRF